MYKSFEDYGSGVEETPKSNTVWYLYGVGLESLGREKAPEDAEIGAPGPDQLLARIDGAGLCFSDTKIIKLGGDHPRLYGRDLANDPIIPGHEAALTIVAVGENRKDKYSVGDRFVVQADIYYKGVNLAFGYMLPGALERYVLIGNEILDGDGGCYLIPLEKETGYSEAALAEPWACVVRAYRDVRRSSVKQGGNVWVIGTPGSEKCSPQLPGDYYGGIPRQIVFTDAPAGIVNAIRSLDSGGQVRLETTGSFAEIDAAEIVEKYTGGKGFDDIFIIGSGNPEAVEVADKYLGKAGHMTFVTDEPFERELKLDVGRMHYDDTYYMGAPMSNPLAGYWKKRNIAPKQGGMMWIVGGAGPMGQMHLQMALEGAKRPAMVVVSDIDDDRLQTAQDRFAATAEANGVELKMLNAMAGTPEDFDAALREIAPDGFDDIVMMAAVPFLISQSWNYIAKDGMMNVFAGVARGTTAPVDANAIALNGSRFVGSSGSGIADLKRTIELAQKGELTTNRAVAGIGGMNAAWDGMEAVRDATFSGKIVIYPQIADLPLTKLEDLAEILPEVAAKLGPAMAWTSEAEQTLLEHFLVEG